MINNYRNFLPLIASFAGFLAVFIAFRLFWKSYNDLRIRLKRLEIVNRYQLGSKSTVKRVNKQWSMTKIVVGSFGEKIVKNNYRKKLETMLVTSGDWENKKYSNLVQRKIYFAIFGFGFGFLFLLINHLNLLPAFFVVILVAYFLPDLEIYLTSRSKNKYGEKLKTLLDQSGAWQENDYFSLIRRKLIFSLNGFVFSYLYLVAKERSFSSFAFTVFAIFMGFFLPDLLLQNKVLKRKEMIANTLADAIDMLQMCVNAGLAFPAALSKVAETQSGPVAEEFARVTAEVQLGQARSDALQAMADRTQEEHVQKFVGSMMQVDRFGIPIGNVLIEQSKEMRAARRERARERGQKVPVKILAPIMLCFLPSVLIIILGPAVISIMKALSN